MDATATRMALVYCPCPSLDEAKRLGNALLGQKLAGCINILPGMISLYEWEGVREEANEVVLIAKSRADRTGAVRDLLVHEHPYDVPAILVLELADVNAAYAAWLNERMS